jgi:hypothetical protein
LADQIKICHLDVLHEYWWFAINPLRFIGRIYGGHVGEKYVPNTLTADIPPTCPP